MFREARQNRIFQDVVEQIQEAILKGTLKEGHKLPPERELREMFKTSRGTLREALRVLEQKGLITIKTGVSGGAIVNAVTHRQVSESLALLIRYQRVSLRDLAEFREGVEGIVAGLAAKRAKNRDIQQLRELLSEAKACLDEGASRWDAFIRIDNEIHLALARIAGNPVYESILQTIYNNIHLYFDRFLPREEKILKQNYRDLHKIVIAVQEGKTAEAHSLVQEHVCRFSRLMEKNQKQKTDSGI